MVHICVFDLHQDHLAKLEFPKTVLAPGGDSGQHDVGLALKSVEESSLMDSEKDVLASLTSLWDESLMDRVDRLDLEQPMVARSTELVESQELLPSSRSWAEQQAYCRSLMTGRMNTPNAGEYHSRASEDVSEPKPHPEARLEDLQRSFSISTEEVAARLKDLRRRPVGDFHIEVPYIKQLRELDETWDKSFRQWLLRFPCEETKRYVGNFVAVYTVRRSLGSDFETPKAH
eukprot:g2994.t1